MLTHGPWSVVPGVRHGFLDRDVCAGSGGWEVALDGVGRRPVTTARQVHGTVVVTAPVAAARPQADALVTASAGPLVGVVTADCVPVLLLDTRERVAAAVHAGWRGAAAGVLEAAIAHLVTEFGTRPGHLEAAIGPAIGSCCYEVGPEVLDAFRARSGAVTVAAWDERAGRRYLDLRTAVRLLLEAAGVRSVSVLGPCTACSPLHHSYRRDGAATGRQLSFVGWP